MSIERPTVHIANASHENIDVVCPLCGVNSRYNRRSDLGTTKPIGGLEITCDNGACRTPLWVVGDSINDVFEVLLFDCADLLESKHYASCAVNASQAFESFGSQFLRVRLCYLPYSQEVRHDLVALNAALGELFKASKRLDFTKMRAVVCNLILAGAGPTTLAEARVTIGSFGKFATTPARAVLEAHADPAISKLLVAWQATKVHELRNKVVHQGAFRPTREEAGDALAEARRILFPLAHRLRILGDDPNFYPKTA
jgi:hypothetical protein